MKGQPARPLPLKAQLLITKLWQEAQNQPENGILPHRREALYRAIWPSLDISGERREVMIDTDDLPLSEEDFQFGHLAIHAVQHVLPIWDRFATPGALSGKGLGQEVRLPRWILEVAQDVLRERIEPLKAYEMLGDFYDLVDQVAYLTPYPVWSVAKAAYVTLSGILGAECFPVAAETGEATDDDPARYAAAACATLDENPAGDWWRNHPNHTPFGFDGVQQLAFWEWWLGTAVPAAAQRAMK